MLQQTPAVAEPEKSSGQAVKAVELADSYREFRKGLLAFLQGRVEDPAVAEDLLHEVFLKALGALDRGVEPVNLSAWLYRIARNSVIDHYRTRRVTAPVPDDLVAIDGHSGLPPEQTLALCLKPFIDKLPGTYRETMLATALEGRTMAAVAEEQGVSTSAVKSRVSRGRKMLREKVLDCCHLELARSGEILDYRKRDS